jgi:phenylpropionate dioxygenase-like ring-hydroxylating dioxygenase large terminal subunit
MTYRRSCSFDTLVENVIDMSHVSYAHHGVPGISRNKAVTPRLEVVPLPLVEAEGTPARGSGNVEGVKKEGGLRMDAARGFTVSKGAVSCWQYGGVPFVIELRRKALAVEEGGIHHLRYC